MAINTMKYGKALGLNNTGAEFLKLLAKNDIKRQTLIFNRICDSGYSP